MRPRLLALFATTAACLVAIGVGAFLLTRGEAEVGNAAPAETSNPDLILYTIGASTDPYRDPSPNGFGVARLRNDRFVRVAEVRNVQLGWFNGAEWLDPRRIVVPTSSPRTYSSTKVACCALESPAP